MSEQILHLAESGAGQAPSPEPAAPRLDTGLMCLVMLARFHSVAADADQLAHDFKEAGREFGVPEILLAARKLGLKASRVRTDVARLAQTPLPAMAVGQDGRFFIVARAEADKVLIHDPGVERPQVLSLAEFSAHSSGELIRARRQRDAK